MFDRLHDGRKVRVGDVRDDHAEGAGRPRAQGRRGRAGPVVQAPACVLDRPPHRCTHARPPRQCPRRSRQRDASLFRDFPQRYVHPRPPSENVYVLEGTATGTGPAMIASVAIVSHPSEHFPCTYDLHLTFCCGIVPQSVPRRKRSLGPTRPAPAVASRVALGGWIAVARRVRVPGSPRWRRPARAREFEARASRSTKRKARNLGEDPTNGIVAGCLRHRGSLW